MEKRMWFGNRNYMQWIKCPESGATYGSTGASQSAGYLNGGAFRRNSLSAAKTFNMSWALTERDNIRSITDYAEGVYGPGALYWTDPFTMDKNVLSQSFATPSLGGYDGVILNGRDERPTLQGTPVNPHGFPTQSAVYALDGTLDSPLKHWIPVPPGYSVYGAFFGDDSGGGTFNTQETQNGIPTGASVTVTPKGVASVPQLDLWMTGGAQSGIEVFIGGTGTLTFTAAIVQVLPPGVTASLDRFISGQGHSGCDWDEMPVKEAYSAIMDYVGMSASFIETEQWR